MLIIEDVVKTFDSKNTPVLDGINLRIKPGDFCVLLGANGSGKSTLLKTITGEVIADAGRIVLEDQDVTHRNVAERAGMIACVAQDTHKGTIGEMTLFENIALSLMRTQKATMRSFKRQKHLIVDKIAALGLGLETFLHQPLQTLSGGQRQMIATIMATLCTPQILLLDEHCSALDPKTQNRVMNFTQEVIAEQKLTTLMITHHLQDAIDYGNRLIILKQGQIVLDVEGELKQKQTIPQLLAHYHSEAVSI